MINNTQAIICGIYKITAPNGYYYIGSSSNCRKRYLCHFNSLKRQKHENPILQNVYNKYSCGWKFDILELVTEASQLLVVEQTYLDLHKNNKPMFMNINFVAVTPPSQKGKKQPLRSIETRAKISASRKGQRASEETKAILRAAHKGQTPWNKGVKYTEEQKSKLTIMKWAKTPGCVAWNKGKTPSEETKAKMSAAKKGKIPWNKGLCKPK